MADDLGVTLPTLRGSVVDDELSNSFDEEDAASHNENEEMHECGDGEDNDYYDNNVILEETSSSDEDEDNNRGDEEYFFDDRRHHVAREESLDGFEDGGDICDASALSDFVKLISAIQKLLRKDAVKRKGVRAVRESKFAGADGTCYIDDPSSDEENEVEDETTVPSPPPDPQRQPQLPPRKIAASLQRLLAKLPSHAVRAEALLRSVSSASCEAADLALSVSSTLKSAANSKLHTEKLFRKFSKSIQLFVKPLSKYFSNCRGVVEKGTALNLLLLCISNNVAAKNILVQTNCLKLIYDLLSRYVAEDQFAVHASLREETRKLALLCIALLQELVLNCSSAQQAVNDMEIGTGGFASLLIRMIDPAFCYLAPIKVNPLLDARFVQQTPPFQMFTAELAVSGLAEAKFWLENVFPTKALQTNACLPPILVCNGDLRKMHLIGDPNKTIAEQLLKEGILWPHCVEFSLSDRQDPSVYLSTEERSEPVFDNEGVGYVECRILSTINPSLYWIYYDARSNALFPQIHAALRKATLYEVTTIPRVGDFVVAPIPADEAAKRNIPAAVATHYRALVVQQWDADRVGLFALDYGFWELANWNQYKVVYRCTSAFLPAIPSPMVLVHLKDAVPAPESNAFECCLQVLENLTEVSYSIGRRLCQLDGLVHLLRIARGIEVQPVFAKLALKILRNLSSGSFNAPIMFNSGAVDILLDVAKKATAVVSNKPDLESTLVVITQCLLNLCKFVPDASAEMIEEKGFAFLTYLRQHYHSGPLDSASCLLHKEVVRCGGGGKNFSQWLKCKLSYSSGSRAEASFGTASLILPHQELMQLATGTRANQRKREQRRMTQQKEIPLSESMVIAHHQNVKSCAATFDETSALQFLSQEHEAVRMLKLIALPPCISRHYVKRQRIEELPDEGPIEVVQEFWNIADLHVFPRTAFLRTVCAILNARKKLIIYLGVRENRIVDGREYCPEARDEFTIAIDLLMARKFSPPIDVTFWNVEFVPVFASRTRQHIPNYYVLEITIDGSNSLQVYSIAWQGGANYFREGNKCVKLSANDMRELYAKKFEAALLEKMRKEQEEIELLKATLASF